MRISRRALVAALVFAGLSACSSDRVTSLPGRNVPPQTTDSSKTTAPNPLDFPQRDGYAADYEWISSSSAAGRLHYVLFQNGLFVAERLRNDAPTGRAFISYAGWFTRVDSVLRFQFLAGRAAAYAVRRELNRTVMIAIVGDATSRVSFQDGYDPAWSPDAKRIAFVRSDR